MMLTVVRGRQTSLIYEHSGKFGAVIRHSPSRWRIVAGKSTGVLIVIAVQYDSEIGFGQSRGGHQPDVASYKISGWKLSIPV